VINVSKYVQNRLNTDLLAFLFSMNGSLSIIKKLVVVIPFIFGLALTLPARPQGTYTAASCNQSDVNAVIKRPTHTAVNGDTTTNCELSEAK